MGRITSTCPRIEKRHSVAFDLRMATAARVALSSSANRAWMSESGAADGEARIAGRLADCLATTTGMPREPMNYQRFQFLDTTGSILQLLFRCDYR